MAAPRAYWKGYLKLSLVTCAIAMYPASSQSLKTRFHQINRKNWERPRYELKRGSYVEIGPDELEAVEVESTRAIDIDKFVPEDEIDKRYYERPYYIVPDDKSGEEAFAVIRDAMKDKRRVALARIVFANREHILSTEPWGKGMLDTTLRYDYEARDEKKFFNSITSLHLKKDMVELAGHILDRKAGHFDPEDFKDEYELGLRRLVRRKAAGHTVEAPEEEPVPTNVINLMDALRDIMKRKKASNSARLTNRKKSVSSTAQRKTARRKAG